MKRHLCCAALIALAVVPDWAGACWPPSGPPQPTFYVPAYYHGPSYCPPVYYPPPCGPTFVVPSAPVTAPRVEPIKGSTQIESPRPIAKPAPKPPTDAVRPAGGTDTKPPVEAPKAPPKVEVVPPAKPDPAPAPEAPKIEIPKPDEAPKLPPITLPMPETTGEPKLPPLELPKTDAAPKLPPIEFPKADAPKADAKAPELPGGVAVPSAAPAPDSLIPPPNIPNKPDALPPLTLPPETPVAPDKPVQAKSSPLNSAKELKVSVYAASGTATATGLRKVGFYNHTPRALSLEIEGKTVTLPAMSYVHAQVPASFTWKCGDRPASKEAVPAGAAGVDVLIRE